MTCRLVDRAATLAFRPLAAGDFVELCDAYDFPLVVLIDSDGCVTTWDDGEGGRVVEPGVSRWHTRPIVAHQHREVPLELGPLVAGHRVPETSCLVITGRDNSRAGLVEGNTPNRAFVPGQRPAGEARGGTINMLVSDRFSDFGEGATYQDTRLDVRRAPGG